MSIYFYDPEEEYGWLANYSTHPFNLDGKTWKTVEHYFQAQKFVGLRLEEFIRQQNTPTKAKIISKSFSDRKRSDWASIKEQIMYKAIKAKFSQNPDIKIKLINTNDVKLVENTQTDYFWGYGKDRTGKNVMGKLLMDLRSELRSIN